MSHYQFIGASGRKKLEKFRKQMGENYQRTVTGNIPRIREHAFPD